ncbi:MAG: nucleotidyltransferase domain-containing protein [Candidatus Margulisiibacteriota bacterium]
MGAERLLKQYFEKRKDIILAFLFGSQAKERARKESDFDIAIWPASGMSMDEINKVWSELEDLLRSSVDLIILNTARPTIAWAALRGKPLLIRDKKLFIKAMLRISDEAEDMQDFAIDLFRLRQKLRGAQ